MNDTESAVTCQEKNRPNLYPDFPHLSRIAQFVSRQSTRHAIAAAHEQLAIHDNQPVGWEVISFALDAWRAAGEGLTFREWVDQIGGLNGYVELASMRGLLPNEFYDHTNEQPEGAQADVPTLPLGLGELLTTQELERWLGCSSRTINRRVREGTFPPPSINGKPKRWLRTAVVKFLEEHPIRPQRAEPATTLFPGRR